MSSRSLAALASIFAHEPDTLEVDSIASKPAIHASGIEEIFYERMFANTGNPED